jgi:hypothetical protein
MESRKTLRLASQIAEALAAAHAPGITGRTAEPLSADDSSILAVLHLARETPPAGRTLLLESADGRVIGPHVDLHAGDVHAGPPN